MKRSLALAMILASGFALNAVAQTSAAAPAGPTKIAVIAFQAAWDRPTNFSATLPTCRRSSRPSATSSRRSATKVDNLQKQLQAQGEKLSDAERASRARTIDEKKKQLQRSGEDAQNDFQQEMQGLYGGVASKVGEVLSSYAQQQGYTLVLDVSEQQSPVLYANETTNITKAVLDAYNVKSGNSRSRGAARWRSSPARGSACRTSRERRTLRPISFHATCTAERLRDAGPFCCEKEV